MKAMPVPFPSLLALPLATPHCEGQRVPTLDRLALLSGPWSASTPSAARSRGGMYGVWSPTTITSNIRMRQSEINKEGENKIQPVSDTCAQPRSTSHGYHIPTDEIIPREKPELVKGKKQTKIPTSPLPRLCFLPSITRALPLLRKRPKRRRRFITCKKERKGKC